MERFNPLKSKKIMTATRTVAIGAGVISGSILIEDGISRNGGSSLDAGKPKIEAEVANIYPGFDVDKFYASSAAVEDSSRIAGQQIAKGAKIINVPDAIIEAQEYKTSFQKAAEIYNNKQDNNSLLAIGEPLAGFVFLVLAMAMTPRDRIKDFLKKRKTNLLAAKG